MERIMHHSRKCNQILTKVILFGIGLTLVACGGGGGGGGGGTSPAAVEYTGNSNPTDVDDTNTQTFTAAIIDGGQDSQENSGNFIFSVLSTENTDQNKQHSMLANLIKNVKSNIKNKDLSNSSLVLGATSVVPGSCAVNPGSFTSTFNQTGNQISASITYNNHCDDFFGITTTTNGSLTASLVFTDSSFTKILSMSMTAPRLSITVVDSTGTYTNEFSGSVTATFDANEEIASMSVTMNFVEDGKTYKLEGLSYTTSGINGADISISGTIFHPDHGSVTFNTTETFVLFNDELCDGTLAVIGVSSNFTITANADCSSYTYAGTNNLGDAFSGSFLSL